jgi:outer membrane protein assembly factor BamB
MDGLRAAADQPANNESGDAVFVEKGQVVDWLVLGPFSVADSSQNFDDDPLSGEASVEPRVDQATAGKIWKLTKSTADDPMEFGTAGLPWLDLAKVVGFERNQVAYAHTYLFSPRGGEVVAVCDHGQGMKAWLNGEVVYRQPQRAIMLGAYPGLSGHELHHRLDRSPQFRMKLRVGWNRLLLKLSTSHVDGHKDMQCCLRLMDPPDVKYDTKNIRWMTELPARSTSTPILVGERLFVMAEPDELLCLDKLSGKVLWQAAVNYYEALTADEKKAKPVFAERVDPLVAELRQSFNRTPQARAPGELNSQPRDNAHASGLRLNDDDGDKRIDLRRKIQETLIGIDEARFRVNANDHFEAHFGIVGATMPTPVSDGESVFVWCNTGVAACYDLNGQRRWIRRIEADHLSYGASPALADGVLAVFLEALFGLDAKTGKQLWKQHRVKQNLGGMLATRVGGEAVFITQPGEIIRPRDGKLLFRPRDGAAGASGWAPGVVIGNKLFQTNYGIKQVTLFDLSQCGGDNWQPTNLATIQTTDELNHNKKGGWLDRSTAGSPLVHEGLIYQVDMYGQLCVMGVESAKMLHSRDLKLNGLMHYNAVPVAASITLVGKHLLVVDNQGTTVVLEPGEQAREVRRNVIATQLVRRFPIPGQETLSYSPPLADGDRLYLRGERFLYCIAPEGSSASVR